MALLGWGDGYYKGEEEKSRKRKSNPASTAEQEHRKRVIREFNALISGGGGGIANNGGGSDEADEEVTDTEWFFLVSLIQSFVNGTSLPGQAFSNSNGVVELGSSETIHQSSYPVSNNEERMLSFTSVLPRPAKLGDSDLEASGC